MRAPTINFEISQPSKHVSLTPTQVDVFLLFHNRPYKFISIYEFESEGIATPSQHISRLIAKGANIRRVVGPARNECGIVDQTVDWYMYLGWT
jgi:hypothetical protein